MQLTKKQIQSLVSLRHELHANPELAHQEEQTSFRIMEFLKENGIENFVENVGGNGFLVKFNGNEKIKKRKKIVIRSDLDALPIHEETGIAYKSQVSGISHKCGHDGHAVIVTGLALLLHNHGKKLPYDIILLYQGAEETGEGAEAVVNDPEFIKLKPDMIIGLHNLPGFELGEIVTGKGVFASTSRGFIVNFQGETSHAAEPENGNTPAPAVVQLISSLNSFPQLYSSLDQALKVTVIHAKIGQRAFGTSPGQGVVMATFRSHSDKLMKRIVNKAQKMANGIGNTYDLQTTWSWTEIFPTVENDENLYSHLQNFLQKNKIAQVKIKHPFPWSEDFGHYKKVAPSLFFGLGSGLNQYALHHRNYDFPDSIIRVGAEFFYQFILYLVSNSV
ncbi:MAG: amidohydrolase [Myxococcota bacterium]